VEGAGNMKYDDDVLVTKDGYELLTSSSNAIVVPV
jgi:Xaa-Pro aminopeptidase